VYISKEDAVSPTICTEAVFLTAVIDALEDNDVAILDVPGAFMQANMEELVYVWFTGKVADLVLVEIDKDTHEPCITYKHGGKVMYVQLFKALYGMV
jgi:hypothetical protein